VAYKVTLREICHGVDYKGCGKDATHRVYNCWNGAIGAFCVDCANTMVERLNETEAEHRVWQDKGSREDNA
jgi:trans-2-enoyl-CoA reductase